MSNLQSTLHNTYVNAGAIFSTVGLSLMNLLQWLDGVLPTISLLLTTITVAVLLYVHTRSAKKVNLEIEKLRRELETPKPQE